MEIEETTCCGIREFSGLPEDPFDAIDEIALDIFGQPRNFNGELFERYAFVMFSQNDIQENLGRNLMEAINDYNLGECTLTGEASNPNTGNTITLFLWKLDHNAIYEYYKKSILNNASRKTKTS